MNIRLKLNKMLPVLLWIYLLIGLPAQIMAQTCSVDNEVDLAQLPLEALAPSPAPANVVFLLDDSMSMDAEVLVADPDSAINRYYLFDNAGDNTIWFSVEYFTDAERKHWRYQWHGYNRLYYNPAVTYDPWPTMESADLQAPRSNPILSCCTQDLDAVYTEVSGQQVEVDDSDAGAVTTTGTWSITSTEHVTIETGATLIWNTTLPEAGLWSVWVSNRPGNLDDQARYDVTHAGGTTQMTLNQNTAEMVKLGDFSFGLNAQVTIIRENGDTNQVTNADGLIFKRLEEYITIPVAHYYLRTAAGTPYLVMLDGELRYFRIDDQAEGQTGHGIVEDEELVEVSSLPSEIDSCLAYEEERQNFANWYSYHRKRSLAATSAVANAIAGFEKYQPNSCSATSSEPETIEGLKDMQVGLLSLNGTMKQSVLPVKVETTDETQTVLDKLYTYGTSILFGQRTLLRAGLDSVGRYYSKDVSCNELALCPPAGSHPMADVADGGACQKQFVVIVTDGAYNGSVPSSIGNQDGDQGTPYADGFSDTLADVAMKYYKDEGDLSSTHEEIQRMHTFAVGFGVDGSLDRDSYPENWPEPTDDATKIDDLWHATVNGRGAYYQSDSPDEMAVGLQAIKDALLAFSGASASVSATGESVASDNTVFVPGYESEFWTGDVKAYTLSENGPVTLKWSAAKQLEGVTAASRSIYTFNGTSGIEFLHASLSSEQKLLLESEEVEYLRGDQTNEQENGGLFRNRPSVLGDIVHSAPAYHDGTVYVGANDGMLHAFSVSTGDELFAYVPYLPFQPDTGDSTAPPLSLFHKLPNLTDVNYVEAHQFFVDLTPTVGTVNGSDYLVGGLGAGGKGYFCLDVTSPSSFSASNVKWEFPDSGTAQDHIDDMGFSFSRAMIVETQAGTKVLFGNGYNSTNGHAVLFILDPTTGAVDKKIDTGAGGSDCNGLSTPVVVDVDNDEIADYAYAGDLKGNLWRFDLTDASVANWTAEHLFQAKGPTGEEQPITTQPDAMFHCAGAVKGILLTFGTGKYLGESDLEPDDYIIETLYGIWDINGLWSGPADQSAHDWGTFNRSCSQDDICHDEADQKDPNAVICDLNSYQGVAYGLLEQTVEDTVTENGKTYRIVSNNPVCWNRTPQSHGGYFLDLPESGERMIADTAIRDFRLIAVSLEPSIEPCTSGGVSYVHVLNACSGGRDPLPQIDVTGDDVISGADTVTSGSEEVPASGVEIQGVMRQPLVLRNLDDDGAQTERLIFPQSFASGGSVGGGNAGVVTVRPERRGNYYWREVR